MYANISSQYAYNINIDGFKFDDYIQNIETIHLDAIQTNIKNDLRNIIFILKSLVWNQIIGSKQLSFGSPPLA